MSRSLDDDVPYTPAWAEKITGVSRDKIIQVAREFATNAEKTNGRSMIIIGAAMNHWYHADMNYRGVINMLVMCGCVGQSGGGWAHYVGQEKLRPQAGWAPLAFAPRLGPPAAAAELDLGLLRPHRPVALRDGQGQAICSRPPRPGPWDGAMIDYNIRAERMGWLPSAPQLETNPLQVAKDAAAAGMDAKDYVAKSLKDGSLKMSCEDPDNPKSTGRATCSSGAPTCSAHRARATSISSSTCSGTTHGVLGKDLGEGKAKRRPRRSGTTKAPEGKLDLLVTLDFRMSTTCVYSDIVLPTATWYEKNDLNTSDMHPFIHPLTRRGGPGLGGAFGLGDLQGHRQGFLQGRARSARRREGCGAEPDQARQPPTRSRRPSTPRTGRRASASRSPARPCRW